MNPQWGAFCGADEASQTQVWSGNELLRVPLTQSQSGLLYWHCGSQTLGHPSNSNGALWEGDGSTLGRDNFRKEADPAKKHGEFVNFFQNLTLSNAF